MRDYKKSKNNPDLELPVEHKNAVRALTEKFMADHENLLTEDEIKQLSNKFVTNKQATQTNKQLF